MLKLLVKKQLAEIFRSYFYDAKKNKARSKGVTVLYFILFALLMVVVIDGMFTALSLGLCGALAAVGVDWLYFTIMALLAVLLGAFGSVFNTFSGLYLAKDNDLLLSLPIPVGAIMGARLLSVYLMGLLYSAVVIVPAVIVYWIAVAATPAVVCGGVLLVVLISVFVLTVSCALGWLVAKLSLKLRHKSLVTVILSLAFLGGYYFFYFKAQALLTTLIENAVAYGAAIEGAAWPLYLLGRVGVGDGRAMALVTVVVLALFAAMWRVLSRSFLKIVTATGRTKRQVYRETARRQHGPDAALLRRELGRFLSSPGYMLNCGLGILLLPVCGVLLLWKSGTFLPVCMELFGPRAEALVPVLLCGAVCMVASMNDMAAPSVSLEGKTLWLVQSLPVTPWQVLRAKLSLQLLLTGVPALFASVCVGAAQGLGPAAFVLTLIQPLSFVLLSALFGLFLGLRMPNLSWTREITPVKQSLNVAIALFGSFGYALALCVGVFSFGWRLGCVGYLGLVTAVTLVLCAVLYRWVRTRGAAAFAAL